MTDLDVRDRETIPETPLIVAVFPKPMVFILNAEQGVSRDETIRRWAKINGIEPGAVQRWTKQQLKERAPVAYVQSLSRLDPAAFAASRAAQPKPTPQPETVAEE